MLDDVETGASGSLPEDDGPSWHFCPEHVIPDVVEFLLRQVVEDEVVLQGGQDEGLVDFCFVLAEGLDALVSDSQLHLI